MITRFIFYFSLVMLFYTYVGYPILIFFLALFFPKNVRRNQIEPKVTIIITAYNEEKSIKSKLENTLDIEYPKDKLEIIVASDASTDRTDEIVKEFADRGVKLFRNEGRKGKTPTQNKAVEIASGDIILFSDATTFYPKDVLKRILPSFADESVGCVSGRLIYVTNERSSIGEGTRNYWNYETFIKKSESKVCSLIGASGCLYAVRRSAYKPMYPEACSDFLIASVLYRQGLRTILESEAVCYEVTNEAFTDELKMRIRIVTQTLNDLWVNRDLLNPFKAGLYSIELFSHKILRYCVPFFLILLFLSNLILAVESSLFAILLFAQVLFYLSALIARFLKKSRIKFLMPSLYFVLANFASLVGFYKFLKGEKITSWETQR